MSAACWAIAYMIAKVPLQLVHLEISLFFRAVRAPQVDMFAQASLYAWAARA